ncbi:MAG: lytic transglycosylase domain-containing protein [Rickettsiales bacterium]|jgi:soluble lytic murein transglycosylase-like protein|nr:lytic transglycosylase domain-containing protein [Rickettsiales bacterium]
MKKLLTILIALCTLQIELCAAEPLPTILSENDAANYAKIFSLQDAGKISAAAKLEKELESDILMGEVLYQRYMSKNYASKGVEVAEWMEKYYNHPGAETMFKLSMRKKVLAREAALPTMASAKYDGGAYSESWTTRKYSGSTGREIGRFQANLKRRNLKTCATILENKGVKTNVSWTDYGRLAGRLAFTLYNGGEMEEATKWGAVAAERNSEIGLWTMGLLSFKNADFAAAEKYFAAMLELEHINMNRKVEAAFWAGRSADEADDGRAARKHWRYAMQRPASFYGAMSAAALGREPDYEFYEDVISRDDIANLMKTKYGLIALALLQAGQNERAEGHLRYLITDRASDDLLHAVHALATSEELPRTALAVAPIIKERGILEIDSNVILSAQFPLPQWEPRGGWEIDRALLFAIARQESRFKTNAKSHAGATGLLQLMPKTAKLTAVKSGIKMNSLDLTNPEDSMFLGQQHVLDLFALENVDNNIIKMLVSYNAGNGNLRKFERRFETDDPLLYIESFHLPETRGYIKIVMSNLWLYRARLGQPMSNLNDLVHGRWPRYSAHDDYANRRSEEKNIN